jgi:hypothetical protein
VSTAIRIGLGYQYTFLHSVGGFGVWSKVYSDSKTTYIIAKLPSKKCPNARPASVTQEFDTLARAVITLSRWSIDLRESQPDSKTLKESEVADVFAT